jgi:hypothetical protein
VASTSGFLATRLDALMLEHRAVHPERPGLDVELLPLKSGREVFNELGGRCLIRYLADHQVGRFVNGDSGRHYTSPTIYPAAELNRWLLLPTPRDRRSYVLVLDPRQVPAIRGPQWVAGPGGIQYVLPNGFPWSAIGVPGASDAAWELELA